MPMVDYIGAGMYEEGMNPNPNSEFGIYGVHISSTIGNATPLNIVARLPENFTIGINSTWEAPLPGMVAGALPSLLNILPGGGGAASAAEKYGAGMAQLAGLGAAPKTQKMSTLLWQDTSPLEFNIPIIFTAEEDARQDVMIPIVSLMKLSAPMGVSDLTVLMSPGPDILRDKSGGIRVRLGRFFDCDNCIVSSTNVEFDTKPTADGSLIYARVDLSITTAVVPTQDDIVKWFKLDGYIPRTNATLGELAQGIMNRVNQALGGLGL